MLGAQQTARERSIYRYRIWQRCIFAFFGVFFALGTLATVLDALVVPAGARSGYLLVLPLLAFPAAYLLGLAFRARVVLHGSRMELRGAFLQRAAERSEIAGFRIAGARFGSYRQLVLHGGGRPISIHSGFKTDDNFQTWMRGIPDLNRRDREALLARIEQQPELGVTPGQRLGALEVAKRLNLAAMAGITAAAVGFNVGSSRWRPLCGMVLTLAPFAAAWLCWRLPLLFAAFKRKQDPRAEASHGLLIGGFGLLFHMQKVNFLSLQPLLSYMAMVALVTFAVYFRPVWRSGGKRALFAILLMAILYAYGAVTMADSCFDAAPAQQYAASVLGGHIHRGRSTIYYLRLSPWGPVTTSADVSVPSGLYHSIARGDRVCLDLHPGRLHVPWFGVSRCAAYRMP